MCVCKEGPHPFCSEKGYKVYGTGVRACSVLLSYVLWKENKVRISPDKELLFMSHSLRRVKEMCVFVLQSTCVHTFDVKLGIFTADMVASVCVCVCRCKEHQPPFRVKKL